MQSDYRITCRPRRFVDFWNYRTNSALRLLHRQTHKQCLPQLSILIGPPGTGKTSVAKAMGYYACCLRMHNQDSEPCLECEGCEEAWYGTGKYLELDGAQSSIADQVDMAYRDTRWLRNSVYTAWATDGCTQVQNEKSNLVVIDEAHRMPPKVQESLLKRVENWPGANVVLITTARDKLDEALRSRGSEYEFCHPTVAETAAGLAGICQKDNLAICDDILGAIALHHRGAPRACMGALHRLALFAPQQLSLAGALELLGIPRDILQQ